MAALTFSAAALLLVIVPFCLLGGVWSTRSLAQTEGKNNKNDDAIIRPRKGKNQVDAPPSYNVQEQFMADNEDEDDDDDVIRWDKKEGIKRQKGVQKAAKKHKKRRTKPRGTRRNGAKRHKSTTQKNPADVVLLVDATSSMWLWFGEQRINRFQNLMRSLAEKFLEKHHRSRIAIAQFDDAHEKILLELGKWPETTINRAISQLKQPGEYEEVEWLGHAEQFSSFTVALITAKHIFMNSPREDNENYDRTAILITDGEDDDRFNQAKILREQFNVSIMVVMLVADAEKTKKDFHDDPTVLGMGWPVMKKMLMDPENDIIFVSID